MKINLIVPGITLCAALAAVSGCGKQESPSPSAETSKPTEAVAPEAKTTVDTSTAAVNQVTAQATAQVNAGDQQAQGLIDRAKSLVADKKYEDALASLSQLASMKLTPDQQKLVDDLKGQIQAALGKTTAGDAASALGGALGDKK
jgi:outer membrane PBP1 activator LpoA protein